MQKWEYFTAEGDRGHPLDKAHLNAIGSDGWELVSLVGIVDEGGVPYYHYVFKRPVQPSGKFKLTGGGPIGVVGQ